MAKKAEARVARATNAQLVQELRKIARILDARKICRDVSPLEVGIIPWHDGTRPGWSYRIEDLLFHDIVGPKCFPCDVLDLACRLSAHLRGYYSVDSSEDPLTYVDIEITLEARDLHGRRL